MIKKDCLVCQNPKVDKDHIKTRGSGGTDEATNYWYLCRGHHREKHDSGLTKFVEKYPKLKIALAFRGWEFDEYKKKWTRWRP